MNKQIAIGMLVILAVAGICNGQGLTTTAKSSDWEEINFEFNSSILTDGFPSLLRLADLLKQNPAFKIKVEGHCDYVGTDQVNNQLSMARAETVKAFLVKYGAKPDQIATTGYGKTKPEVSNTSAEGRFMNRRATLTLIDGKGTVVTEGSIGQVVKTFEDCCQEVLKKLDKLEKLDEILALLKDLKAADLDGLKKELADLRAGQSGMKQDLQQMAAAPKPPVQPSPSQPSAAQGVAAAQEAEKAAKAAENAPAAGTQAPRRFTLLALNAGHDQVTDNFTLAGKVRFFQPIGTSIGFQSQAEYIYDKDRQETQLDLGLVDRFSRHAQLGLFSSFKHVQLTQFNSGGMLGQASGALDFIFSRGRFGIFGTKSFLDGVVVNRVQIAPHFSQESYLKVVDQVGFSAQVGLWGNAYLEGNAGALFRQHGSSKPGGSLRFVQPVNAHWAFTAEGGLNETLVSQDDSGRLAIGIQFGNFGSPKEYQNLNQAIPVDVPRIRYEVLTRRVKTGNDAPVADAGPNQLNVAAGAMQLDGSGSFDPDGDPITYQWTQIQGPAVTLSGAGSARASFTAEAGTTYAFRLTVRDDAGGEGLANTTITTAAVAPVRILRFLATPTNINSGDSSTLVWSVENASSISITGVGNVSKDGTSSVTPTQTTTYTLTAQGQGGTVTATATVTVAAVVPQQVRILRFYANPTNINSGDAATLIWSVENATSVQISGIGTVSKDGSSSVTPTQTTTYTLTAQGPGGPVTANATVTVASNAPQQVRILRFYANPTNVNGGDPSTLIWSVENATSVQISGIGTVSKDGSSSVAPAQTTTYTLTAQGPGGPVTANATVTVTPSASQQVRILRFYANPTNISSGDASTLIWAVENATSVQISGIGTVSKDGSSSVTPTQTTTYTLTAQGPGGPVTTNATVTVATSSAQQVRILRFYATPTNISAGGTSTLIWSVENATSVQISGIGTVSKDGTSSVSATETTTYTLTAQGPGGPVTATATVAVSTTPQPTVNHAPIADAGRDITAYLPTASLDGSNSYDPDGDNILYSWVLSSGPQSVVILNDHTAKPTVNFVQAGFGYYIFQLTVTDSHGVSSSARVTVSYR
jgi:hypothetical protein